MGIFNRRPRDKTVVDPAAGPTNGHHDRHHREKRASRPTFDKESGHFNRRPSFGQW